MEEVEVSDEEANLICLALQHITVYVPFGEVIRPIYLAKSSLMAHVSSDIALDPNINPQTKLLKLKELVKSRVSCSCMCCTHFTTYSKDIRKINFNCQELRHL